MRITSWLWFSSVAVLASGPLWLACGGSEESGGVPSVDDGEGGSRTSSGTSGAAAVDASAEASASATDAGPDGHAPPSDAGPGGTTTSLQCGPVSTCSIPSELCCVVTGAAQYTCTTAGSCPNVAPNPKGPGSAALACTRTENCAPGLLCCLDIVAGQSVSSCQASCAGAHAQLCAAFTANPGCPVDVSCTNSHINEFGLPTLYATCGGVKN